MDIKNKRILVVGLGRTGMAVSKFLAGNKARTAVSDSRPVTELKQEMEILTDLGVMVEAGGHLAETFLKADLIVVSPGIPRTLDPLIEAEKRGIKVISEIELAANFIKAPIIAVTGTNGKTTTTSILGKIMKEAGKKAFIGGNIGNPLIEYPYKLSISREAGGNGEADYIIAEISSFQLEGIKSFRPHVGILLNVSEDHLSRYSSYIEYVNTKFRLFKNQGKRDFAIINRDDHYISSMSNGLRAATARFSCKGKVKKGIYLNGENILLSWGDREEVYPVNGLKLKGAHNMENIMAAIAAARICGIERGAILRAIMDFDGLPHRMEWVRDLKEVSYFNDSKATNVGAVERSLQAFDKPVLLIAGGRDKGGDYRHLRKLIEQKVRTLILMGEAREKIRESLGDCTETILVKSMKEAVSHAFLRATSGNVVLFSPACSSYDMFKNYEERGGSFRTLVMALGSHKVFDHWGH
ncbi:MAG: UDP-N-acetylmuramoyl-L-alanine--D-glutamate ligase [Thermodesulfobacteriota bacterium]